jgi:hypothetical protein
MEAQSAPTVWIIQDRSGLMAPLGLVSVRFDEVQEWFRLGVWSDLKTTAEYEDWLSKAIDPVAHAATFGAINPSLIDELRLGQKSFSDTDLDDAEFLQVEHPPKFDFTAKI